MLLSLFCLYFLTVFTKWTLASNYREDLVLTPLPQSALLAAFSFQSNISLSAFEQQNYNLFPRSLGQILQHAHTKELHLRFGLGRWDAENWGVRPRGGRREGGTGVEMWAWVEADTEEEASARWLTLTNALSGLFCASLNFIDSTNTIRPTSTFEFEGTKHLSDGLHLLHGALPHEVVCTENLTPFLKLLPCKGKAGISTLLDGHKLFDASWQTMAVDIRPTCPSAGSECLLQVEQTVDMVLDIVRSTRPSDDPIPRPQPVENIACNASKPYHGGDTCFPTYSASHKSWTLKQVFGRPIRGACPLDESLSASVHLEVPSDRVVSVETTGRHDETKSDDGRTRHYQIPVNADFDIALEEYSTVSPGNLEQPLLHADRTFTGHGQERGGVRTVLSNPSPESPVELVFLESLPWFMKPYLHTLLAQVSPTQPGSADPVTSIVYRPGIDRHRGTLLELHLTIPAASTLTLTYDFEKAILRYTEYPPDANRGFDVAPAIIRILPTSLKQPGSLAEGEAAKSTYMRTTSLLLPLPTPDFSMPYNVIILTSTVIAMGFGTIFNLLVRRFIAADEHEGTDLGGVKARVLAKVKALKDRLVGQGRGVEEEAKKTQ